MKEEDWIQEKIEQIVNEKDWIDIKISRLLNPLPPKRCLDLFGEPKSEEYYIEKNKEIVNANVDWSLIKL